MNRYAICAVLIPLAAQAQTYERAPVSGAVNSQVTQSNIRETICNRTWERASRPPVSWSEPYKLKLASEQHVDPKHAELDHAQPLCLGGAAKDPRNLWLQTWQAAHVKDEEESALCKAVCGGRMTLDAARKQMAQEWLKQ